jgi:ABC-type sugar transport system ATPase subunit
VAVPKDGELQQADAPQPLFDAPANLFVATFIGSPAMNLAEAMLVRADGGLAWPSPATGSRCPRARSPGIPGWSGSWTGR